MCLCNTWVDMTTIGMLLHHWLQLPFVAVSGWINISILVYITFVKNITCALFVMLPFVLDAPQNN